MQELLTAMKALPSDTVLRWFATSGDGPTLRLTLGQLRKEFSSKNADGST